jgi:hypothetical protein
VSYIPTSDKRCCLLQSLLSDSWLFAFQSASIYHLDACILSGIIQIVSQIVLLRSIKPHYCLLVSALATYLRDVITCINLCCLFFVSVGIATVGNTFSRTSLRTFLDLQGTHFAQLGHRINGASLSQIIAATTHNHLVLAVASNGYLTCF